MNNPYILNVNPTLITAEDVMNRHFQGVDISQKWMTYAQTEKEKYRLRKHNPSMFTVLNVKRDRYYCNKKYDDHIEDFYAGYYRNSYKKLFKDNGEKFLEIDAKLALLIWTGEHEVVIDHTEDDTLITSLMERGFRLVMHDVEYEEVIIKRRSYNRYNPHLMYFPGSDKISIIACDYHNCWNEFKNAGKRNNSYWNGPNSDSEEEEEEDDDSNGEYRTSDDEMTINYV